MTDSRTPETVTVPRKLAIQIQRLLDTYAEPGTYTYRERIGGVLKGCPRGPQITVEQLALKVRIIRDIWRREVSL